MAQGLGISVSGGGVLLPIIRLKHKFVAEEQKERFEGGSMLESNGHARSGAECAPEDPVVGAGGGGGKGVREGVTSCRPSSQGASTTFCEHDIAMQALGSSRWTCKAG